MLLLFTLAILVFVILLICILRPTKKDNRPSGKTKKYDYNGFDHNHIHRNGTKYDDNGYDFFGFDESGFNKQGYNSVGKNQKGKYNRLYDIKSYMMNEKYNSDGFLDYRIYPIAITAHARQRMNERMGINSSVKMDELAKEAYCYGKSARQLKKTSAALVYEIQNREDDSVVLIYRSHIYIFSQDNVLKTVYPNDKIPL